MAQLTKLTTEVCRILDFPHTHAETARHEAVNKEKLVYTYMRVNGSVLFVRGFDFGSNTVMSEDSITHTASTTVETLEPFLPETGIYEFEGAATFVEKLPLKQWKKSYHPDYYHDTPLKQHSVVNKMTVLDLGRKVPFFVGDCAIYAGKHKIGEVKDKEITLKNYNFYQDVLDWITKEKLLWKIQ